MPVRILAVSDPKTGQDIIACALAASKLHITADTGETTHIYSGTVVGTSSDPNDRWVALSGEVEMIVKCSDGEAITLELYAA